MAVQQSVQAATSGEEQRGLEEKLQRFRGRWTTTRERKDEGKVRRYELVLEFDGSELTFYTEEDGNKANRHTLKVHEVDQDYKAPHLVLGFGGKSRYIIHYDFEGERLILVGRMLNRPFEGFSLSGEYTRAAQ